MIEFSLNPIEYVTRVWTYGKAGRMSVISCIIINVLAVFMSISLPLNGLGLTAVLVIPIGFWLWLGVLVNQPRLEVIWQGRVSFPAKEEHGDHPIHSGSIFYSTVITVRNTGLKKLNLEPRMVLEDIQTGTRVLEMRQMEVCPLSAQKADIILSNHPMVAGRPPHCPPRINLDVDSVITYHLEFMADKFFVDKIGFSKLLRARYSLKFIDTIHGVFKFREGRTKKGRAIIECKHSRAN